MGTNSRIERDFLAELKAICDKPRGERPLPPPLPEAKRYNIHKRSLPVGIDKKILLGVGKEEAQWWVENKLKTKCFENELEESKTIIYFDILPVDATPEERSIYHNSGLIVTDGFPKSFSPRRIN